MLVEQHNLSTVCDRDLEVYKLKVLPLKRRRPNEGRVDYICGSPITTEGSSLHDKSFVQTSIHCMDHVEFAYYACLEASISLLLLWCRGDNAGPAAGKAQVDSSPSNL